jgi:hypothetical protein
MDDTVSRLRESPDELDVYVTRIAEATGIPPAHVEKDFWLTEVLRAVAQHSDSSGCTVVFKGGTSLSKAHKLIQRFSEDADVIVIIPESTAGAADRILKNFVAAVELATGIEGVVDSSSAERGVKRAVTFRFPSLHDSGLRHDGILLELGTRGGALPASRLPLESIVVEHAEQLDLPLDFDERDPFSIRVLAPVRTLVEKLMILHHAAGQDERRQAQVARHYYDVHRLLDNELVRHALSTDPCDVLAREVSAHSRAAGLQSSERPVAGFAASPAFDPTQATVAALTYRDVVLAQLIWPGVTAPSFEECCAAVRENASLL